MLGRGTGIGRAMRSEAASVISDARATTKHVNILKEGVEAEQGTEEEVRIRVALAEGVSRPLALAVRDALVPVRAHATVSPAPAADAAVSGGSWDVVIALSDGADPATADVARTFARAGLPVAIVAESADAVPATGLVGTVARRVTPIVANDAATLRGALAEWLVRATGKGLAMAASFPFARRAEAEVLARECAGQNAAVAAFNLVPGSDLPVMAANQVRLAITYATLYGQGVSIARAVEMLAVVGTAVAYRRVAKSVHVPGLAIATRAAVGYTGTMLTGQTLMRYYARLEAEGGAGNVVATFVMGTARHAVLSLADRLQSALALGR